MLLRANCPASGVPASTPRSSDRCEICCSFKPRFLFFSLSLCLFVNLCFSFSCQPRSLANLGLLPTSDGKQLWERDCIRDVHGVCAFSDSCCGLSFFVVFVVLSCRETAPLLPYNWPPLTLSFSFSGELIAELPENRGCSAAAALHPSPGGHRPLPISLCPLAP